MENFDFKVCVRTTVNVRERAGGQHKVASERDCIRARGRRKKQMLHLYACDDFTFSHFYTITLQ